MTPLSFPRHLSFVLLASLLLTPLMAGSSFADEELDVLNPWIRFAPPNVAAHAGFLSLSNKGAQERILIAAKSPAYGRIELHTTQIKGTVAMMRRLDKIRVKAGSTVHFKSGGTHLMMMMPKGPQKKGEKIPIVFTFQNGQEISFEAVVQ